MRLKLIFLPLSIFLATQLVTSFPAEALRENKSLTELYAAKVIDAEKGSKGADGENANNETNKSDELFSARKKLPLLAEVQIYNIGKQYLKDGTIMINRILEDGAKLENAKKSENVDEHLNEFSEFLTEMKEAFADSNSDNNKITTLYNLVEELSDLLYKFNSTSDDEKSPDELVVEELLLRNGAEELERAYYESFSKFVTKIIPPIEDYIESLSDEGRKNESDLIEWYEEFKDEKDVLKQVEIFNSLYALY